jgi:hypothetical protein
MKKGEKVVYEWWLWTGCKNHDDRSGDFDASETYAQAARHCDAAEGDFIELTRSVWCEDDGLLDRLFATVEDEKLPEFYDGSTVKIAKKLHAEVKAAHKEERVPWLEDFFKL